MDLVDSLGRLRRVDGDRRWERWDVPAVLVLVAWAEAETWLGWSEGGAGPTTDRHRWARGLLVLAIVLPLLARRRAPLVAQLVVCAAIWLQVGLVVPYLSFVGGFLPLAVATFATGAHAPRVRWLGLASGFTTLGVLAACIPEERQQSEVLFGAFVLTCTWLAGDVVRERFARAHAVEAEASAALEVERGRMARELHDVIAHGVSVMGVQAGAARRLVERGDAVAARQSLLAIEEAARTSVGELGRLLAVLRGGEARTSTGAGDLEPAPGLARIPRLVHAMRTTGLPVEVVVSGRRVGLDTADPAALAALPAVPPGLDLVVYRVVQESLTNTLKHVGPGTATRVSLDGTGDGLTITVDDHPTGGPGGQGHPVVETQTDRAAPLVGHGLVGMRERVALYGGRLDAGPRVDGGFRVRAWLPVTTSAWTGTDAPTGVPVDPA